MSGAGTRAYFPHSDANERQLRDIVYFAAGSSTMEEKTYETQREVWVQKRGSLQHDF